MNESVLITGCSTGIGRALVESLSKEGFLVWATARRLEDIQDLQSAQVKILSLDVTQEEDIQEAYRKISLEAKGPLSLINNAGLAVAGPVEALSMDAWRKQFEVNVFAPLRLTQVFLPLIRKSKGRVINMSSVSGRMTLPYLGAYSSSKFALEAMSDALRRECAVQGVKVVLIEPSAIQTPIWKKSNAEGEALLQNLSPAMRDVYEENLRGFEKMISKISSRAAPLSAVTEAVSEALRRSHPKPRYLVGRGAKLRVAFARLIPTLWMDRLLERTFGIRYRE